MRQEVFELHALLDATKEAPPYVMVGQSIGGLLVRLYADAYPGDVAGVVLVDPTHESGVLGSGRYGGMVRLREKATGRPVPRHGSRRPAAHLPIRTRTTWPRSSRRCTWRDSACRSRWGSGRSSSSPRASARPRRPVCRRTMDGDQGREGRVGPGSCGPVGQLEVRSRRRQRARHPSRQSGGGRASDQGCARGGRQRFAPGAGSALSACRRRSAA